MINRLPLAILVLFSTQAFGQNYERNVLCDDDTINVDHFSIKTRARVQYQAFECTKVSKLGIRIDAGFNHYRYNAKTENWLGNHNGPLLGLTISYGDFNVGVKFKPATVRPRQNLDFNGEQLTGDAKLNPNKIDYDFSYSVNFKHNISLEPYIALTANSFFVINEKELGKNYSINKIHGLTAGVALNKYFHLKDFQFFSIFAKYGYGLTNFKKAHASLGAGYSDIAIGIAYKGFIKQSLLKRI